MYLFKIKCTLMRRHASHRAPQMHTSMRSPYSAWGCLQRGGPREASCTWYPHSTVSRHLAVRQATMAPGP